MIRTERNRAMEKLPEYLGAFVHVTSVDRSGNTSELSGVLEKLISYSNGELNYFEARTEGTDFLNGQNRLTQRTTGIPFIGLENAIMSITKDNGPVIYENYEVLPFYCDPKLFPKNDNERRLEIKELSFGKQ